MYALFGHLIAKIIYISLKPSREEQLGLLLTIIQDIKVLATSILPELGWPTLQEIRDQMKLTMMYKIIHRLV